jgi:hypothetical protein
MFASVLRQVGGFHLYLQLLVGGLMSYLRYLCLLARSGVHVYCVGFFSSSNFPVGKGVKSPCSGFLFLLSFLHNFKYYCIC